MTVLWISQKAIWTDFQQTVKRHVLNARTMYIWLTKHTTQGHVSTCLTYRCLLHSLLFYILLKNDILYLMCSKQIASIEFWTQSKGFVWKGLDEVYIHILGNHGRQHLFKCRSLLSQPLNQSPAGVIFISGDYLLFSQSNHRRYRYKRD